MESTKSRKNLASEVWRLFINAKSCRVNFGVEDELRHAVIRDLTKNDPTLESLPIVLPKEIDPLQNTCGQDSGCTETSHGEVSLEECARKFMESGPFDRLSEFLKIVKIAEYHAAITNVYAPMGDKPFQLKSRKNLELDESDVEIAAKEFYDYIEALIEQNNVRVHELSQLFDYDSLVKVSEELTKIVRANNDKKFSDSVSKNSDVLHKLFKNAKFMQNYLQVLKDVAYYPLGILWLDWSVRKKNVYVDKGRVKINYDNQPDSTRVDPRYFWVTSDWRHESPGRACFRLRRVDKAFLTDIAKGSVFKENIDNLIRLNSNGFQMNYVNLFSDELINHEGQYDVLVCRGKFKREDLTNEGVEVDGYHNIEYIPAEVWFSANKVLQVKIIPEEFQNYGVFTTTFRQRTEDTLWGISLTEFVHPFAEFYQGVIDNIDTAAGKTTGSITSLDTAVLDDPDKYIQKNAEGAYEIDFSGETLIVFNSRKAAGMPNFKGKPVHVDQFPSDLPALLPLINLVFTQLEQITGIPAFLMRGTPDSSALRTDGLYEAAYQAASKPIQYIIRTAKERVLVPSIHFFYVAILISESTPQSFIDIDPEIITTDEIENETLQDNRLVNNLGVFAQFRDLIPNEKMAAMINGVARELGYEEEIIPDVNPLTPIATTPSGEV